MALGPDQIRMLYERNSLEAAKSGVPSKTKKKNEESFAPGVNLAAAMLFIIS